MTLNVQLGYMHTLSSELANESQEPGIRQAAAIAFKNAIAVPSRVCHTFLSLSLARILMTRTLPLNKHSPNDGSRSTKARRKR